MRSVERLLQELSAGARDRATMPQLAELISRALKPVVAHDGLRLVGASPAVGIMPGSFSLWHGYEADVGGPLLQQIYAGDDPCRLSVLARQRVPAGVAGVGDGTELRWVLRDSRGAWGGLALLRAGGGRPFDRDDLNRVRRLDPMLLSLVRGFVAAGPLTPVIPRLPAGVIILGPDNKIRAATPQLFTWRHVLQDYQAVPAWLAEACFAALAVLARNRLRDPRGSAPLIYAPTVINGRWLAIEAQPLDADGTGDVAIVLEAASSDRLLPVFCDWYGITAREREVIGELCEAAAPKQIARRLDLSVYTVNDHLKAVFRKTGAGCRAELIAALTS